MAVDMRGLIPRCLDFIFAYFNQKQQLTTQHRGGGGGGDVGVGAGVSTKKKPSSNESSSSGGGGGSGSASSGSGSGGMNFMCTAQFLEVYQEQVHDLLDSKCPVLKIREDLEKGVYVDGACEEDITDAASAQRLLNKGEKNR